MKPSGNNKHPLSKHPAIPSAENNSATGDYVASMAASRWDALLDTSVMAQSIGTLPFTHWNEGIEQNSRAYKVILSNQISLCEIFQRLPNSVIFCEGTPQIIDSRALNALAANIVDPLRGVFRNWNNQQSGLTNEQERYLVYYGAPLVMFALGYVSQVRPCESDAFKKIMGVIVPKLAKEFGNPGAALLSSPEARFIGFEMRERELVELIRAYRTTQGGKFNSPTFTCLGVGHYDLPDLLLNHNITALRDTDFENITIGDDRKFADQVYALLQEDRKVPFAERQRRAWSRYL